MFWRVVIALLAIAAVVSLVMLLGGSRPVGSENLVGRDLPDFAAPLLASTSDADANIYTREQARTAKQTAACDVDLPQIINSCRDLRGRAVLVFFNPQHRNCLEQVTRVDRVLRKNTDVNAVAIAFDTPRTPARRAAATAGWKLPVALDRDGALAGLYAVAGCPTTFFSDDGVVREVRLGLLSDEQLGRRLAADDR